MKKPNGITNEIVEWISEEIIGEEEELRDKSDMIEATYHRVKGRNELRREQERRLREDY